MAIVKLAHEQLIINALPALMGIMTTKMGPALAPVVALSIQKPQTDTLIYARKHAQAILFTGIITRPALQLATLLSNLKLMVIMSLSAQIHAILTIQASHIFILTCTQVDPVSRHVLLH